MPCRAPDCCMSQDLATCDSSFAAASRLWMCCTTSGCISSERSRAALRKALCNWITCRQRGQHKTDTLTNTVNAPHRLMHCPVQLPEVLQSIQVHKPPNYGIIGNKCCTSLCCQSSPRPCFLPAPACCTCHTRVAPARRCLCSAAPPQQHSAADCTAGATA